MSCERYTAALTDHAMGAPLDRAAEAHLVGCAACRARLERNRQAMTMLDDELAGALAVEPSMEFQAQVRVRIANVPPPARFWPRALILAAAATVVILVGLLALQSTRRPARSVAAPSHPDIVLGPSVPDVGPTVRSGGTAHVGPTFRSGGGTAQPPRVRTTSPRIARAAVAAVTQPEVIVPTDRAEAIRRYVVAVAAGRVEFPEGALPEVTLPASDITPLTIEPIVIPPSDSGSSTTSYRGF